MSADSSRTATDEPSYEIYGKREPSDGLVIIFPGFGCRASHYEAIATRLSSRLKVPVAAVTFSAFGNSDHGEQDNVPMSTHGQEAIEAFDRIVAEIRPDAKKVVIVGHCYGTAMGAHLAGVRRFGSFVTLAGQIYPDFAWNTPRGQFPKKGEAQGVFEGWKGKIQTSENNRLLRNLSKFRGHIRHLWPTNDKHVKMAAAVSLQNTNTPNAASVDSEMLYGYTHNTPDAFYKDSKGNDQYDERRVTWWERGISDALERHIGPTLQDGDLSRSMAAQPLQQARPRSIVQLS